MRISDWSSDVCSSDLQQWVQRGTPFQHRQVQRGGAGDTPRTQCVGERRRVHAQKEIRQSQEADRRNQYQQAAEHQQDRHDDVDRSEEHTSELQSLMRISYAVFCLTKKKKINTLTTTNNLKHKHEH